MLLLLLLLWYTPWYMIYLNTHLFFYSPIIRPSSYYTPQKKTTSFYPLRIQFIHFKKVLCCWRLSRYIDKDNVRKNKKVQCQRYVWSYHVLLKNDESTYEQCHRCCNRRKKIGMNTNVELNYFVIIILTLVCISKSFLFGLHTTYFNYIAVCCKMVLKTLIPAFYLTHDLPPDLSQLAIHFSHLKDYKS